MNPAVRTSLSVPPHSSRCRLPVAPNIPWVLSCTSRPRSCRARCWRSQLDHSSAEQPCSNFDHGQGGTSGSSPRSSSDVCGGVPGGTWVPPGVLLTCRDCSIGVNIVVVGVLGVGVWPRRFWPCAIFSFKALTSFRSSSFCLRSSSTTWSSIARWRSSSRLRRSCRPLPWSNRWCSPSYWPGISRSPCRSAFWWPSIRVSGSRRPLPWSSRWCFSGCWPGTWWSPHGLLSFNRHAITPSSPSTGLLIQLVGGIGGPAEPRAPKSLVISGQPGWMFKAFWNSSWGSLQSSCGPSSCSSSALIAWPPSSTDFSSRFSWSTSKLRKSRRSWASGIISSDSTVALTPESPSRINGRSSGLAYSSMKRSCTA